jgi:hypothetical protein
MNIVLGDQALNDLVLSEVNQRYMVLELDTFRVQDQNVKSYCVVDSVPVNEIPLQQQWSDLHSKLIENYQKRNWNFCLQALEHLKGRWNGQIDSFYLILENRINNLVQQDLDSDWNGVIDACSMSPTNSE